MKRLFYRGVLVLALGIAALMVYAVVTGFPVEIAGKAMRCKNLKPLFTMFALALLAAVALNPRGKEGVRAWRDRITAALSHPSAVWVLFGAYAALFTWQQLTHYFTAKIHFIPFCFYDYMLCFFSKGLITYTGLLHGYYHANFILFLLSPVWDLISSPLLLVSIYGLLAALAILPLYAFAKEKFKEPVAPFFIAFIYLNYRYLQNVVLMNFSVEILYPLFLFMGFYFALKSRWLWYYCAVVLGLLIKEDSFVYFSALGLWVFCHKGKRLHGVLTAALAVAYFVVLAKVILPFIGSNILAASLKNYRGEGDSAPAIVLNLLKDPGRILGVLFGSAEKLETYFNLFYRLLFLPLFSPSALLIFIPLFPLFLHSTGRDTDFIVLNYHYAAAVLPFVMIAFVSGFANLVNWAGGKYKEILKWAALIALILINGGHYRTEKIKPGTLETIRWARSLPPSANVVTHGHLLPHVGYLPYNYYIAGPWERPEHPYHRLYDNADYYLIDLAVDPYPMNEAFLLQKIEILKNRPEYRLARQTGARFLFERVKQK